jgi:hypothetical protein
MACSLSLVPLAQLRWLAGQEHDRTIPLAEISLTSRLHSGTCLFAAFSRDGENGLASLTAAILSREA